MSATNVLPIVTDRLVLRRLTPADMAAFQIYRHDEEVGQYQDWQPQTDAEAIVFLEEQTKTELFQPGVWFQIGIADRETGALIGDIGVCLSDVGAEAEIGFTLRRQSQGLGLARESVAALLEFLFEHTDINKIVGIVDARNTAAIRLLEKVGMRFVQTNEAIFRDSPCEELVYELLR